jgi:hypothetical protein
MSEQNGSSSGALEDLWNITLPHYAALFLPLDHSR